MRWVVSQGNLLLFGLNTARPPLPHIYYVLLPVLPIYNALRPNKALSSKWHFPTGLMNWLEGKLILMITRPLQAPKHPASQGIGARVQGHAGPKWDREYPEMRLRGGSEMEV